MDLILASASPRRKALLEMAGIPFRSVPSGIDESIDDCVPLAEQPLVLAGRKAAHVAKQNRDAVVLGCDTSVLLDGQIFGKPKDAAHAAFMLGRLSGRTHQVVTGCVLLWRGHARRFSASTDVTFYALSAQAIDAYVKTGEPMDKAGAYGIQGKGALLVRSISGDYFNVVGLPLAKLARELTDFTRQASISIGKIWIGNEQFD